MSKLFAADYRRANSAPPPPALEEFGWGAFFERQLGGGERGLTPARVTAVHRDALEVVSPSYQGRIVAIPMARSEDGDANSGENVATVGDWLLLDEALRPRRILSRRSLFKRRAAGTDVRLQLIAANVDTLFIVSSCNLDFNVARLERYLALAREAEVTPFIVLTKADLSEDSRRYVAQAARLMPGLMVEALDARAPRDIARLEPWCVRGQTIALMGSSGVGKSTLLNTLSGEPVQETADIRAGDDKGRHTTTGRSLHRLRAGGWIIDTPGMRELRLTDAGDGINEVFADIAELGRACRFADCAHESEPGCAVQGAISEGRLDDDRLKRYRKLLREDLRNTQTLAESHERARKWGRLAKNAARAKRDRVEF